MLEKFWPMKTNNHDDEIQFRQITAILDLKDCGMRQVTGKNRTNTLYNLKRKLKMHMNVSFFDSHSSFTSSF